MAQLSKEHAWEYQLLTQASEAWQSLRATHHEPIRNPRLLQRAYRHCEAMTAAHSRSFYLASTLLPPDKRRAVRALYAFCRTSDDLVDRPSSDPERALQSWRLRALAHRPAEDDLVAVAWSDAVARYRIPHRYAEQLISGVARDLYQMRYASFEDLAGYAYGVASTVGLMSMHIVGFSGPEAMPSAIKLGVALQVTNALRDVGEDFKLGRIYLPQNELAAFGLGEDDLAQSRVDGRWRAFMRFQIARNRRLYAEAWSGIALLDRDGRFAIAAAAELYRGILDDIEANDYDVFSRRAHVSTARKARVLARLWLRDYAMGRAGRG